MSSSSVCQGLQSCLEPRVIESHVLRLKLAPPRSNFSSHSDSDSQNQEKPITNNNECNKKDTVPNVGGGSGWSFLQALANTTHCNKTEEQVYVHPTVKRSSSMLSEKSLEMCTESLGSETGSNAGENSDEFSLFSFDSSNTCFTRHNTDKNCVSKRVNRACSFPPPLTSMGGVHVRPHREGGRLILEAVASPSPRHYFHAERSKGRLRLCLFESFLVSDGDDEVVDGKEGIEEEEEEEEEEAETQKNHEVCGEEDTEGEEELEEFVDNVEDEMEVTKFARPRSRCKESGNRDIFGDGYFELPSLPLCL
ncbi:protein FANTASTIC FOUR 1-like [Gastrolobium bilobum]|uniref:protein FANTASTIC FOUR 1-like n=1 Tax=Gastrolobium bilobum TaxID=150636 RepID=UPI002AB0C649|nr:protein FANTASTIC FOUR 1-like [Gastrolobium bilobum]